MTKPQISVICDAGPVIHLDELEMHKLGWLIAADLGPPTSDLWSSFFPSFHSFRALLSCLQKHSRP
jgi:hypothetical protein